MNRIVILSLLIASAIQLFAQNSEVKITSIQLTDKIYMLQGRGGNIGVIAGAEGVMMIDDQFAPLSDKILATIEQISGGQPLKYVLNTHWHGDHTGGNENMGKAGGIIVAHENVRTRMSQEHYNGFFDRTMPPSAEAALPVITFSENMAFYFNEEEIQVIHLENGHTDGDAVVWFKSSNVIHTGDLYFSESYPYVDISSGGTYKGVIAAIDRILLMANDQTKIIPGHGKLSKKADLVSHRQMILQLVSRIEAMIAQGKTLEEIQAAKPTEEYDKAREGWLSPEDIVELIYLDLSE